MLEGITDSFREAIGALTSDTDRLIYLFVAPLIISGIITAFYYRIFLDQTAANTFLTALANSGSCNTIQPYLITALVEYNGLLGYCQVLSFNVFVFMAWYLQILLILFVVVYVLVNALHLS